ncbi:hypothetical protein Q8F55_000861 [Vanrija albida]|uniref:Uncharacterized protein n=1 Tax=Vanrija albida TaxID=181172 RepID=A0ABR3QEN7_9TREE
MTVDNTLTTSSTEGDDGKSTQSPATGIPPIIPPAVSFSQWISHNYTPGITIPAPPPDLLVSSNTSKEDLHAYHSDVLKRGYDSYGQPFIKTIVEKPARPNEYKPKEGTLTQLHTEDCFKIGVEGNGWVEIPYTCQVKNDPSIPPFIRLVDATNDFWHSRAPVFQRDAVKYKSSFETIRAILGLRRKYSVEHWPGTGDGAQPYVPASHELRHSTLEDMHGWKASGKDEACPLLRHTDRCVRGFLAIARRETESLWGAEHAVHVAEIFAAFISYLDHYKVLNEPHLAPKIHRAAKLARSGPLAIKNAFAVEEIIEDRKGLNYSCWVRYGGSYRDRRVGESALPASAEDGTGDGEDDDGGWGGATSEASTQHSSPADAEKVLGNLFQPFSPADAILLNYIAFGRRRVVAVIPPEASPDSRPNFKNTHYRLRTVPAPFTEQEQWRSRRPVGKASDIEKAESSEPEEEEVPLELEKDTIETPDEIDIWIDGSSLNLEKDSAWLIGMGIRGRWAEIKIKDGETFWIAKMKDYVLPSFWQATESELAEDQSDPPSPYTDEFLAEMRARFPVEAGVDNAAGKGAVDEEAAGGAAEERA